MPDSVLDCKDMACPGPVLECKKLLDTGKPAALTVLVDNDAAKENVTRFLSSQGYGVDVSANNGSHVLTATLDGADCEDCRVMTDQEIAQAAAGQQTTVFITADAIGRGDDELGHKLMKNFLATLPELGPDLWRVVLVNSGVKLAAKDHPALGDLQKLAAMGAGILVCGTCLEHYGLLESKSVGMTTNMLDVVTSLQAAAKVIQV